MIHFGHKHTVAEDLKIRISFTSGRKSESHFDQGEQIRQYDASDTCDIHTKIDLEGFQLNFKEILFDYFKIAIGTFTSTKGTYVDYTFIGETVQMIFLLKGNSKLEMFGEPGPFKANECNIFFGIEVKGTSIIDKGKYQIFLIDIQKEFFTKFFPKYKNFVGFRQQIEDHKTGYIRKQNLPITPEMHLLINSIIGCQWKDHFRKIHIHSKLMELLLLQLNILKSNVEPTRPISAYNMAKMDMALKYLSENYRKPPTLKELSKKIGTNEFLLKRDFKIQFGTTVFGYVFEIRMKKAKELLLNSGYSISQVSEEVGYKNPQHFSTAFKRKFGVCPSSIKK